MQAVKCKECREVVAETLLRDHWAEAHSQKLREIDKWLGHTEAKLSSWEKWQQEIEAEV